MKFRGDFTTDIRQVPATLHRYFSQSIQSPTLNNSSNSTPASSPHAVLTRSSSVLTFNAKKTLDFSSGSNLQLAQQLTLIEYSMMKMMRNQEFLKQAWSKSGKEEKAANIMRFAQWFNKVSAIVSTDILKCVSPEERWDFHEHFLGSYRSVFMHEILLLRLCRSCFCACGSAAQNLFLRLCRKAKTGRRHITIYFVNKNINYRKSDEINIK